MTTVSLAEARQLALHTQLLDGGTFIESEKTGTLKVIEHLGYVQIDTISVVERAHHHVLWSRVPAYHPRYIAELMSERRIFEYWSHAAAYLPTRDFRFSLVRKGLFSSGGWKWSDDAATKRYVIDRIRAEGPLGARDFAGDRPGGSPWMLHKPAKLALEHLWMDGTLMVERRDNFQKIYDLTERVLPADTETTPPTAEEYVRYLIITGLRSHGLVSADEIAYLRRESTKKSVRRTLETMTESGEILPVSIVGTPAKSIYYSTAAHLELTFEANPHAVILSPFDSMVIQRKRLQRLFSFDYQIECYVPAPRRKFGYFCLPLLYCGEFIGTADCKADRTNKILKIISLHLTRTLTADATDALVGAFVRFAKFNDCERVESAAGLPEVLRKEV